MLSTTCHTILLTLLPVTGICQCITCNRFVLLTDRVRAGRTATEPLGIGFFGCEADILNCFGTAEFSLCAGNCAPCDALLTQYGLERCHRGCLWSNGGHHSSTCHVPLDDGSDLLLAYVHSVYYAANLISPYRCDFLCAQVHISMQAVRCAIGVNHASNTGQNNRY